jgi:hypothetical protein
MFSPLQCYPNFNPQQKEPQGHCGSSSSLQQETLAAAFATALYYLFDYLQSLSCHLSLSCLLERLRCINMARYAYAPLSIVRFLSFVVFLVEYKK